MYANASAQTMTGATQEELLGNLFWRCAPQLVSAPLYQAVLKTKQTRALTKVEYCSPMTRIWLHVHLAPTVGGLMLQFHEMRAPVQCQEVFSQGERLSIDDLNSLHARIGVLTLEGIVLEINEVPLAEAHIRREEVIGQPLAQAPWWSCSPASQEQLRAAIKRASTGETVCFEALVHTREGIFLNLEVTIIPHIDADHHIQYLVIAGIDIAARKRAEAEIHALIDAIPQLVWIAEPDGYVIYNNQRWLDYTGLSTAEAQGDGWFQCMHPDDRQRVLALWQRAIRTGTSYEAEQRLLHGTTGEYRWFLTQAMPYKDAQGKILKYIGTCTDIDGQKRAELRLKESRENLHVLVETVPQLVWLSQPDGSVEYWSQRWYDYTGSFPEQTLGDGWSQFLHPDDYQRTLTVWCHALATGESYEIEYRLKDSNAGSYRWFLTRGTPVRDEAGQIIKWFGTCTDIDDQKRIEEALRESQERASVLMNSSIIGINIAEGEQMVDANDTFLHMTGYTREDLRAGRMNLRYMTPPDYLARTRQAHQELATQQSMTPYEKEYVCKDGSRLPVLVCGVVLQHRPFQSIAFVLDNSARKELEQRKEDFISMASHELKTPLTSLKMQIQLVRKRLERQSFHEAATTLSRVEGPVKQLERLIGELLDVSTIQAGRLEYLQETVDLDALLHEMVDTMQQLSPTHTIVVRGAAPCSLIGDTDRLGQVFINLISNAIKYSPDAETVEIDLSASPETATIRVREHGLGIPQEQRDKIFERFYRVSGPSQKAIPGLGMGLYIVAEIVRHHGGILTVESEVGKGSTFQVTLPLKREV